jgi:hypothetical protein
VVSPQNPVVIPPRSEPQPDLLLLRPRAVSYSRELPTSQDVLLAVEVADTSVRFVSPFAFPDVSFTVSDFFA